MNLLIAALLLIGAPACDAEDGSGQQVCAWQANEVGNKIGHSFVIWNGGTPDARIKYISHRKAARILAAR